MTEKLKKLEFDKNYNNKLLCLNFIAVVSPVPYYDIGERIHIRLDGKHFCFAEVLDKKELEINVIIKLGYNYLDMGLAEKEYREYICSQFSNKRWYDGDETKYTLVFFKKIVQLRLFDDNENLDPDYGIN